MSNILDPHLIALSTPPSDATRQQVEAVVQAWRVTRADRLEQKRKTDQLEKTEKALQEWLVNVFEEQKLEGVVIDGRITGATSTEIPVVDDKEAFVEYIYSNEALDLLQFRISTEAIKARRDAGEEVAGTGDVEVWKLYDRKA